jgi:hypothetical protein
MSIFFSTMLSDCDLILFQNGKMLQYKKYLNYNRCPVTLKMFFLQCFQLYAGCVLTKPLYHSLFSNLFIPSFLHVVPSLCHLLFPFWSWGHLSFTCVSWIFFGILCPFLKNACNIFYLLICFKFTLLFLIFYSLLVFLHTS